ncbi:MAG: tRNA-dihydrouridine synthase B [Candidatus Azotimanducaceae bacterium]|jgi:tRNA-dihydrouridine synthase B
MLLDIRSKPFNQNRIISYLNLMVEPISAGYRLAVIIRLFNYVDFKSMLKIGPFQHESRVIVAPMAGVTDQPFRNMCRSYGAHWLVSEMLTSDTSLWKTSKSANRLRFEGEIGPRWVQIAGAEPAMMAEAARFNEELGASIIDINMGCPAKKVCRKAAGSALMKDEALVQKLLTATVTAVSVPVTLKIRLGWSRDQQNAVEIAKMAEASGVQLITVHGRTRADKFSGEVDYEAIGRVVDAVSIPVVANGDIDTPEKAMNVLSSTGADAVMIGRGAQGNPWLPAQVDYYLKTGCLRKNPNLGEIKHALAAHISELSNFYGDIMGVRIARKHVGWYLDACFTNDPQLGTLAKKAFNLCETLVEQIEVIEHSFLRASTSEALFERASCKQTLYARASLEQAPAA